jgi:hypothetical protein
MILAQRVNKVELDVDNINQEESSEKDDEED